MLYRAGYILGPRWLHFASYSSLVSDSLRFFYITCLFKSVYIGLNLEHVSSANELKLHLHVPDARLPPQIFIRSSKSMYVFYRQSLAEHPEAWGVQHHVSQADCIVVFVEFLLSLKE